VLAGVLATKLGAPAFKLVVQIADYE
jgi:hypothetical protein